MRQKNIQAKAWPLAMMVAGLLAGGCAERELSERPTDGPLVVRFEWPATGDYTVEGARLWLYGSDGQLYAAERTGAEGYEARVPAGTYTLLVVNEGMENVTVDGEESSEECLAMADRASAGGNVLEQVDHVYCTGMGGVVVKPGNVATEVTMAPVDVVRRVRFDIDPSYVDRFERLEVWVSGITPAVTVINGRAVREGTGSVVSEAEAADGGHYTASMSVFGWTGVNEVTVRVVYPDGSEELTIPVDISDDLAALPEEGGEITVTLELPDGGEITLTVTVTAWDETGTGSATVI